MRPLRNRALVELLYAAGLRVSEALGLDLGRHEPGLGRVRVIGKGDRSASSRSGTSPSTGSARYLAWPRGEWVRGAGVPDGATAPCS